MKKKLLIIITVLLIAVMTVTFVACKKKIDEQKVFDAASYSIENGETSRDVKILVSYNGETVYDSTSPEDTVEEVKDAMEDLGAPLESKFSGTGAGLKFQSDYFANASIVRGETNTEYAADISAISTFLGVNGSAGKIIIILDNSKATLQSMKISYTTEDSFNVEITVTMKY